MSKILQGFKNWVFESRSFLFSWYTQDRNQIQEPTKSLVELPQSQREELITAIQKLSDNPTDSKAIRSSIDETFTKWHHNKIWTEPISNANTGELEAQVVTDFYFAHEVDTSLVTKILYRAAHTSRYTQLELPIAVVMEETPYGTHFKLKSYPLDARDEFTYKTDLINKAKIAFAKYNLTYPRLLDLEQNQLGS